MLQREVEFAAGVSLFSGLNLSRADLEAVLEEICQSFSQECGVCFFDLIRLSQKSEEDQQKIYAALKG